MKETGLIHIYTGDGKGKTTAAIGLAVRAAGGGLSVCYTSFHKNPELYGYTEMDSLRRLGITVVNYAKGHPHLDRSLDDAEIAKEVAWGLEEISRRITGEHYDLLIMDEIIISVRDGYITEDRLVEFIRNKPQTLELVITGRGATQRLIELADYVSNIQKIKHPYDKGIFSRKGIEF